jgi:hypothetical protein
MFNLQTFVLEWTGLVPLSKGLHNKGECYVEYKQF